MDINIKLLECQKRNKMNLVIKQIILFFKWREKTNVKKKKSLLTY